MFASNHDGLVTEGRVSLAHVVPLLTLFNSFSFVAGQTDENGIFVYFVFFHWILNSSSSFFYFFCIIHKYTLPY